MTKFLENTRNCDPEDWEEVAKCMIVLRKFHSLDLKVEHDFDIFGEIELYEKLWGEINRSTEIIRRQNRRSINSSNLLIR